MNKFFCLITLLIIAPSVSAQDELGAAREHKKAAQVALKKKMGHLRNEQAMNDMTKRFENVSLKKEPSSMPADERGLVRNNMIPGFEEYCRLYDNEFPKNVHPWQ